MSCLFRFFNSNEAIDVFLGAHKYKQDATYATALLIWKHRDTLLKVLNWKGGFI